MAIPSWVLTFGIPTAITGFFAWWIKRNIDKREKAREEKEKNTEQLMIMMMKTTRANNILALATAKAVQRIPDAKCNGDMTKAIQEAAAVQYEEKEFLISQGIKRIFE